MDAATTVDVRGLCRSRNVAGAAALGLQFVTSAAAVAVASGTLSRILLPIMMGLTSATWWAWGRFSGGVTGAESVARSLGMDVQR